MADVFLSYAHPDREIAAEIIRGLSDRRFTFPMVQGITDDPDRMNRDAADFVWRSGPRPLCNRSG
jgi:hypothetical protein